MKRKFRNDSQCVAYVCYRKNEETPIAYIAPSMRSLMRFVHSRSEEIDSTRKKKLMISENGKDGRVFRASKIVSESK